MEDQVVVGQIRRHPVFGRGVVRYIVGRLVLIEFANEIGNTYFEDIVRSFKLMRD